MRRHLPFAEPVFHAAQRACSALGFQLTDVRPPVTPVTGAEFYRPLFQPWLTPEWRRRLQADDPRSLVPLDAKYTLYCLALDAIRRCTGDFAECGVYKGGTARILAELASTRPVHLFDTFAGMPAVDPARDLHHEGDFADTSLESVKQYLAGHANVSFHPGLIPASLAAVQECKFSFVHVDLDIYAAIRAACDFFYPRLDRGGVMLFDDYAYASCPGARAAVDEFFADKEEVAMVLPTGGCSVRKL